MKGKFIQFNLIGLTLCLFARPTQVFADVQVSKAQGYVIVTPPPGVSVSKAQGYVVVTPPPGVFVSKAQAYVV